jgi:hypothetical protein
MVISTWKCRFNFKVKLFRNGSCYQIKHQEWLDCSIWACIFLNHKVARICFNNVISHNYTPWNRRSWVHESICAWYWITNVQLRNCCCKRGTVRHCKRICITPNPQIIRSEISWTITCRRRSPRIIPISRNFQVKQITLVSIIVSWFNDPIGAFHNWTLKRCVSYNSWRILTHFPVGNRTTNNTSMCVSR